MGLELVIAEKEFKDSLASKRFIAILAIVLLLTLYGVSAGINNYNSSLNNYKNQMAFVNSNNMSSYNSPGYPTPPVMSMPDTLSVFNAMIPLFSFMGMILGVAMGFDQISREKEEGSLKFLAGCPLYRDTIINGKTIGAVATLAFAIAAAFLVAVGIVIVYNMVPGFDDLLRIFVFYLATLLYCIVFFAIGIMMSTFTKNTSTSIIFAIGIVVGLSIFSILSVLVSSSIAQMIVGPLPVNDGTIVYNTITPDGVVEGGTYNTSDQYIDHQIKLLTTESQINDLLSSVSPFNDYGGLMGMGTGGIGAAILSHTPVQPYSFGYVDPAKENGTLQSNDISLLSSLASVWTNILVLIVEMIVAFAITYISFTRMDIR
jgi:ABC-2 type transport system permease protein